MDVKYLLEKIDIMDEKLDSIHASVMEAYLTRRQMDERLHKVEAALEPIKTHVTIVSWTARALAATGLIAALFKSML